MTDSKVIDSVVYAKRRTPNLRVSRLPDSEHLFNAAMALPILIFILPLLLVVAALVYFQDGGAPIFRHRRIGRGGRSFGCLKFRSMAVDAEQRLEELLATSAAARLEWARSHKLTNDPRITPLGDFLRRSSLDELPQLLNVLLGEMNLVGPRPIVQAEMRHYRRYASNYCSVRPGITGLWQVSGRSDTTYRRRVAMDVVYARNKTFGFDLAILLKTIPCVLRSHGAR